MKLLVAYATSEGQTRKIARHVADRLADAGHAVELLSLKDAAGIDPGRFDRIILGASVHVGHYQRALADFVSEHAEALKGKPALLLSVSLAAAGHRAEDWRGIEAIVRDFEKATGWSPDKVGHVAGAYTPSQYDIFSRFVMRRIITREAPQIDPEAAHEFTDWPALDSLVDDWLV